MLYRWELSKATPDEIAGSHFSMVDDGGKPLPPSGRDFAARLMRGTIDHLAAIDPLIETHAKHWRLARMAVIDRLILRLAVFELAHDATSPPNVVIDEALELARTFSEPDAIRFVNGVLDAIHRELAGRTDG
jgi:N utilization substance protein B